MQTQALAASPGWLKDKTFDLTLVVGITLLACAMGLSSAFVPALFLPLLAVHTWCFGFDHVIATFTRLAGSREDRERHRFLIYALPPLVFVFLFGVSRLAGIGWLSTGYFFFQWFHTTRQSWGLAQHYRRVAGGIPNDPVWLSEITLWAIPVTGLLHRCQQQPAQFLFNDLYLPLVPASLVTLAGLVSAALVLRFFVSRVRAYRAGVFPAAHTLYFCTHLLVFTLAYLAIDDLHAGWLLVNVWHNVQYLAYVWMKNRERFGGGVRKDALILSWLCQPGAIRAAAYFLACLAISTPLFGALYAIGDLISMTLLFAYTVNLHHYIVDGIIWKRRAVSHA